MKLLMLVLFSSAASAHEMTPTYFKFKPSIYDGFMVTELNLWNRRSDVSFYQVYVYDEEWNPVVFNTPNRIFKVQHLGKTGFPVYIRKRDEQKIVYICTESKLIKGTVESTGVTSKICSKKK